MKHAISAMLFMTFCSQCLAEEPREKSVLGPYYDCMMANIDIHAKKSKDEEEAIFKSMPYCEKQLGDIVKKATIDFLAKGLTQDQAERTAKLTSSSVNDLYHPDFVRAAVDAAPKPSSGCTKLASVAYKPPMDLIFRVTEGLEELTEKRDGSAISRQQYNRELKLLVTVGKEGLIRDAIFIESSGNRLVDLAARNWAFGLMFTPLDCNGAFHYKLTLPIVIFNNDGVA